MPANVYTSLLWSLPNTPAGPQNSPTVPAGFVWVVRNITLVTPGQPYSNDRGWVFTDSSNGIIFARPNGATAGAMTYYYDGRQLLDPQMFMVFSGASTGYSFRVTGYVLSLP